MNAMPEILRFLAVAVAVVGLSTGAWGQASFYQGKTMTYIVNMAPGDSPDLWARAVARNMVKHIAGNPNMITQNMPGGGSMIAANYLYSVAKPDGLTIGAVSANLYFRQLTGTKEVQFDWKKFTWIGSNSRLQSLLIMRADAPYKSIDDIRAASEPPKCSTTALGSTSHITLKIIEEGLGAKFRIVTGYKSGSDQDLAVERGEVQCRAVTTAAFLAREPFQTWQKKGFIRVLAQTPRKRNPKLPDVPTVHELMDRYRVSDASRRFVQVMLGADNFGNFPTAGPPGIPPDRVKILRDAYAKALHEPDFLEEAKKRNWEIDDISGEELEALAKEVIDQPPPVLERIRQLLGS
ncbi:MAG TPA: tripartite tricarboxylate transporter substrate-binding protein [Candidatus Acidoferrales bacterium]|nr:tripartite tricarboxylate transporter substrate-binding protein [Candidatus Acidoferrales bacterium]